MEVRYPPPHKGYLSDTCAGVGGLHVKRSFSTLSKLSESVLGAWGNASLLRQHILFGSEASFVQYRGEALGWVPSLPDSETREN